MGEQSGKFYDAVKMREFCDGWKDLVLNYAEKNGISDSQFSSMRDTESFRGMTADQSKLLVKKGMGRMLREVAKTQKKMRKAQTEVMELFENMVDPSQNARIEYDTLEMINNDFKELYYIYKDRADNVRRIVDCLNNEFGNYAYFEQPDSQTGLDAFYDFCGGDSDTAGYLRKCQDKLAAFDMQAKALLSGKDTMTKTENLNTHIVNTKIALAPAPTSGVTSCKVTLDPVDNSKATANAKKNTKDDMYSYLQSYYGFTDEEMEYLKANYPNLLTTLYNAQSSSTRLEMRTYEKIMNILKTEYYKMPEWYGNPMSLNGTSEQEKILNRQLSKTTKIEWNQEKIDQLWKGCEEIYDEYGINLDPRLLLAVICAEGTGSFNTSSTNLAGDGQNGVEADYGKDLLNANNILLGKILG
jgi:hypothetical protein